MFHARQDFPGDSISPAEIPGIVTKRLEDSLIYKQIWPGMQIAVTMGSHGGATAEGQRAVLAHYHVTEETMGCPVKSSMETVYLGDSSLGHPVYMDKNAYEADCVRYSFWAALLMLPFSAIIRMFSSCLKSITSSYVFSQC